MTGVPEGHEVLSVASLAEVVREVAAAEDVDVAIDTALAGVGERFGMRHAQLLAVDDEDGPCLVTIATAGYPPGSIGGASPVEAGQGVLGAAMQLARPVRIGNLQRMLQYARAVRDGQVSAGAHLPPERPIPGLLDAQSQLAVPLVHAGRVTGALLFESPDPCAFHDDHEAVAVVLATLLATALELERTEPVADAAGVTSESPTELAGTPVRVRHYSEDGSTFVDDAYLVRGVPGRLLAKLLNEAVREGRTEFTNREVRLDPTLQLPAHKDNLESRLILLRRRLDEHDAPFRIVRTGRGRFRLVLERPVLVEHR